MPVIEFQNLTKTYPAGTAVKNLSASVEQGKITGFLGPNGAGKSTTLRCLLGLAAPTSGQALINGLQYRQLQNPLTQVGAVLDSRGFNASLTGRQNLRVVAAAAGITDARVDQVLDLVELSDAANRRTKGYSLGMKQRLALAGALLGDPQILVLDEPSNGLDPIGIAWLRTFLRQLANQGRTVLISSHQLAEMQHTVDDVLILHQGVLVAQGTISDFTKDQSLEDAFLKLVGAA
ncbi:MAG: ABC transporter ATP-binding protein [Micrococcales bacterium]